MRFLRLVAEGVRGISKAEVEFGPGLNVLYGPNDLGKSTLADAIRAALLLPVTSSDGAGLIAWARDAAPRITLVFSDDNDLTWRIEKTYGEERPTAELAFAKDGQSFAVDVKGRGVDGALRKLLRWGIPSPGGKGAPRGLPVSFLAKVLLAPQAEVDDILALGLNTDDDESGKLRLNEALAALAQDPALKRVLEVAQSQVDAFFTTTGQKKRGQASPFAKTADDVRQLHSEFLEFQKLEQNSALTENRVTELRGFRVKALDGVAAAKEAVAKIEGSLSRMHQRTAALQKLDGAKQQRDAQEREVAQLIQAQQRLAGLESARVAVEAVLQDKTKALAEAEARQKLAEENLRNAKESDGGKERSLALAALDTQLAKLGLREQELLRKKADGERLVEAELAGSRARANEQKLLIESEHLKGSALRHMEAAQTLKTNLELADGIVAFGRWREAVDAEKASTRLNEEIQELQRQAKAIETELEVLPRLKPAPSREELASLRMLEKELAVAEASLGGGLAVVVRPKRPIGVTSRADGVATNHGMASEALTVEAQRQLTVSFDDLVEVEVEIGAAEGRKEAKRLRERWEREGAPALFLAGVATTAALDARVDESEKIAKPIDVCATMPK